MCGTLFYHRAFREGFSLLANNIRQMGLTLLRVAHQSRTSEPRPDVRWQVYESGAIFDPKVLDITDDDLLKTVKAAIATVTAVSLGASVATLMAVPHLVINGFRNVLAVALEIDYSFPLADKVKHCACPHEFVAQLSTGTDAWRLRSECLSTMTQFVVMASPNVDWVCALQVRDILANPDAYAATTGPAAEETAEEAPKAEEAKEEEEEEEEDDDMGFSLFD